MNPAETLKDPVCGMTVTPQSPHRAEFEGRPVYFCCGGCKAKFEGDPHKYLHARIAPAAEAVPRAPAPAGTVYTCPMHPEIRQDHPGTCPKCGMALEPEMPSARRRRESRADGLPAALLVDAAADDRRHRARDVRPSPAWFMDMATQSWVELVLSTPVVLWAGWPFFVRGVQSIVNRSPNMWTLIGIGTAAAFVYSVVATIAPGVFPGFVRLDGPGVGVLRGRRGHHLADAAGPAPRAEGALADVGGDQVAARPGAEDGAADQCRRQRRGRPAHARARRRLACACGPARRCRSTASSSKAQRASTNRC